MNFSKFKLPESADILFRILRLPLEIVLLTFHYSKSLGWLAATIVRIRWFGNQQGKPSAYFRKLRNERHKVRRPPGWPFGCFTQKSRSGYTACIPGGKYANLFLFRSLCPDVTRDRGSCSECICSESLQRNKNYWNPPITRLLALGLLLTMLWSTVGYGIIQLLPSTVIKKQRKADHFFAKGKQWMEEGNYNKASLAFRNAIAGNSNDSQLRFAFGQCLLKLTRYEDARQEFERSVQLSPNFWEGYLELAKLMAQARLWNSSITHAKKVCGLKPDQFTAYAVWIDALLAIGRLSEAKLILRKGIDACTFESLESCLGIANLAGRVNALDQAHNFFRKALTMEPKSIVARIGIAQILLRQSQWDPAKELIDQVLTLDPKNWQAKLCRAQWFVAQSQWDQALKEYEALGLLYPRLPYPKTRRSWILSTIMDQQDKGLQILEEVLRDHPHNQEALLTRAQIHFFNQRYRLAIANAKRIRLEEGSEKYLVAQNIVAQAYENLNDFSNSIKHCKNILKFNPRNFTMTLKLANGLRQEGKFEEALDVYGKAAALDKRSHLPQMYSGNIYFQQKDLKAALKMYEQAYSKNPQDPILLNNLALLILGSGTDPHTIDRAFQLLKDAAASENAHPMILDTFGWILFKKGDFAQSKEFLVRATEQKTDHPLLFYHLGKVCFQLKELEAAKQALENALGISTEFEEAQDAQELLAKLKKS